MCASFERGKEKVRKAASAMVGMRGIEDIIGDKLHGRFILGCVTPTPETGAFVRALHKVGVEMSWCADNRFASDDDVVAYLQSEGVSIFAKSNMMLDEYFGNMNKALALAHSSIQVVSDGADIFEYMARIKHPLLRDVVGATEQTACGITILQRLYTSGDLHFPTLDVDGTTIKKYVDNYLGVGASLMHLFEDCGIDILERTENDVGLKDKFITIFGYGYVGRAAADFFAWKRGRRGIHIVERDPTKLLQAKAERGYCPVNKYDAIRNSDICVTATGVDFTIDREMIQMAKDGVLLCNIGHGQLEYDTEFLEEQGSCIAINEHLDEYTMPNGKKVLSLCKGALANMIVSGGNPDYLMGVTFTLHALGQIELTKMSGSTGILTMPKEIVREATLCNFPQLKYAVEGGADEKNNLKPCNGLYLPMFVGMGVL